MDSTDKRNGKVFDKELRLIKQTELSWISKLGEHVISRSKLEADVTLLRNQVGESKKRSFLVATRLNDAKSNLRNLEAEFSRQIAQSVPLQAEAAKLEEEEWEHRSRVRAARKSLREACETLVEVTEACRNSEESVTELRKSIEGMEELGSLQTKELQSVSTCHNDIVTERDDLVKALSRRSKDLSVLRKQERGLQEQLISLDKETQEAETSLSRLSAELEHISEDRKRLSPKRGELNDNLSRINEIETQLKKEESVFSFLTEALADDSKTRIRKIRNIKCSFASKQLKELKSLHVNLGKRMVRAEETLLDLQLEYDQVRLSKPVACEKKESMQKEVNIRQRPLVHTCKKRNALLSEISMLESHLVKNRQATIETESELKELQIELAKAISF
jgi:chromosome segregation ATPase